MLTHLMLRKRENRERLKEKERMMVTWNLMMPSSLLQVHPLFFTSLTYNHLFIENFSYTQYLVGVTSRFSGI